MPRILVTDDSIDNLDILNEVLIDEGYDVICAANAADAVASAKSEKPDLILMDLQMPLSSSASELDDEAGLVAATQLRADRATESIPIIVLSGYDTAEHVAAINAVGCNAIGRKPYDFPALLLMVAELLQAR